MEIRIDSKDLIYLTNELNYFIERNIISPVHDCALITATGFEDMIVVRGQKNLMSIDIHVPAEIISDGKGLYPIMKINKLVNSLNEGPVDISIDDKTISISQGDNVYKTSVMPADEYNKTEYNIDDKRDMVELTANEIKKIFKVKTAAYDGHFKPALSCVDITIGKNRIESIATDSRIMAYQIVEVDTKNIETKFLLAIEVCDYLLRIKNDMYVWDDGNIVIFKSKDRTIDIYINKVDLPVQDYKVILSQIKDNKITIDRDIFKSILKRLKSMNNNLHPFTTIIKNSGNLELSIITDDTNGKEKIDVLSDNGKSTEININLDYLLNMVTNIDDVAIDIEYKIPVDGNWDAVKFTDTSKLQYVFIMPLQI